MDTIISTVSKITNDRAQLSRRGLTNYRSVTAMKNRKTESWRGTTVNNREGCAIAPIWVGTAKWGALILDPDRPEKFEIYQFDQSGKSTPYCQFPVEKK